MYGSPFCTHSFTEEQLALEQVTCLCGNKYETSALREYARLQEAIAAKQLELGSLVRTMAMFNSSQVETAVVVEKEVNVPAPKPPKPPKPKRKRPSLSVTQWLIVTAGFMVVVAASIFVSQNLNSWNVWGWSTLEFSLGAITAFGALRLKKYSVLLSNFLAVFSSAMVLTLIMSISTQFGLGFTEWNREPTWFWSINLALTAGYSLLMGLRSKNFGWRAMAPLSIAASAILLVSTSAGTFEDKWRSAILSFALFLTLICVRLARDAKGQVSKDDPDKKYLEDLVKREDEALKRFGVSISVFLAGYAAVGLIQALLQDIQTPIDGASTIVLAAIWLAGARLKTSWVTAITASDKLILTLRNAASAVGISALGLGGAALAVPGGTVIGLITGLTMLALVIVLENFAKKLLLPTVSVTIAIWLTLTFGALWNLSPVSVFNLQTELALGWYLGLASLALSLREWFNYSSARSLVALFAGLTATFSLFAYSASEYEITSPARAAWLGALLVLFNAYVLVNKTISKKANQNSRGWINTFSLIGSALLAFFGGVSSSTETKWGFLLLGIAYLVAMLGGSILTKDSNLSKQLERQGVVALVLLFVTTASEIFAYRVPTIQVDVWFIAAAALISIAFAYLNKRLIWAHGGYLLLNGAIVLGTSIWLNSGTGLLTTVIGIALSGLATMLLVGIAKRISEDSSSASLISKVATAATLASLIVNAVVLSNLTSIDVWSIFALLTIVALAIEMRSKSTMSFIYASATIWLSLISWDIENRIDSELHLLVAIAALMTVSTFRLRKNKNFALALFNVTSGAAAGLTSGQLMVDLKWFNWEGPEFYSAGIALGLAGAALISKPAINKASAFLQVDLPVLVATIPSLVYATGSYQDNYQDQIRLLTSAVLLLAHNVWRARKNNNVAWLLVSYATSVATGFAIANNFLFWTKVVWEGPEIYALSIAGTLVAVALATQKIKTSIQQYLLVDLPVLVAAVPSLLYALTFSGGNNHSRLLLASVVIFAQNVWRTRKNNSTTWSFVSYISATVVGYALGDNLSTWFGLDWNGPEVYSLSIAASLVAVAWLTKNVKKPLSEYLLVDLPVVVASVPSLAYALAQPADSLENSTRFLLASTIIWAHNIWRTAGKKSVIWLGITTVSGLLFAWSVVREFFAITKLDWDGPEFYSLMITVAMLVSIRFAKQQKLFEGTLIPTGIPLALLLTPSVVFTWSSVASDLNQLTALEISRTLTTLALSISALLFGMKQGNRGAYLIGTFELWLVAVPALWFKAGVVAGGEVIGEFRGLLVAGLIFWAFGLLRQYQILRTRSLIFIGIPVAIALTPALLNTLAALGGGEIRTVDWWRFSIVLTASLTLLIVGALREVGGTFFPGLLGVIITVLPYGFHPLTNSQWFLWIILLGVAGLLVWLAMRLENMRKAGREPSTWLKELK